MKEFVFRPIKMDEGNQPHSSYNTGLISDLYTYKSENLRTEEMLNYWNLYRGKTKHPVERGSNRTNTENRTFTRYRTKRIHPSTREDKDEDLKNNFINVCVRSSLF